MRAPSLPLCVLVLALPFAVACERSVPSAFAAHGAGFGTARLYDATLDEAWVATRAVLADARDGDVEEHFDDAPFEPFMLTYDGKHRPPSNLDQVGVWFLPEGSRGTLVKIVVMSGVQSTAGIVGPDESSMHRRIADELARMRREDETG
jgi:hypothetical protein